MSAGQEIRRHRRLLVMESHRGQRVCAKGVDANKRKVHRGAVVEATNAHFADVVLSAYATHNQESA
jgi:hypothetical protein